MARPGERPVPVGGAEQRSTLTSDAPSQGTSAPGAPRHGTAPLDAPGREGMLGALLEASHLVSLERFPELVSEHAAAAGLRRALIYLADVQEDVLRLLTDRGDGRGGPPGWEAAELRIDGSLAGRVFQSVRTAPRPEPEDGLEQWWVPLLDGSRRLGVMRVSVPVGAGERVHDDMRNLASLVALVLTSKHRHSDSYARLVRTRPMSVAAEMQWNLMPPLTFANGRIVISAAMEPAYDIGGDAFDYSLSGDTAHLAVFDAMGHDTAAGLNATLAVAACRSHRRRGMGLVEVGEATERVLLEEFGHSRYVTAVMADLDLGTGSLTWINHGHHPPVLIRGGRWVSTLECAPAHPLGADLGLKATLSRKQLEPGDRVLLHTDGITEARNARGREFGLTRFTDFVLRENAAGLPVPETLRRLMHSVVDYHDGRLRDDATVLLAEWRGP